jgi:hypothetical protein
MPFHQDLGTVYVTYTKVSDPSCIGVVPPANIRQEESTTTKVGSQVTDSEEHPGWRRRVNNGSDLQDIGGDFFTQKRYVRGYPSLVSVKSDVFSLNSCVRYQNEYRGPVWAIDARTYPWPNSEVSSNSKLDQLGATAISRCKPTNSAANIATTIGELVRERGISKPQVQTWEPRTAALKERADNFLDYQFGLKPLGQEIGTFAACVLDSERLLAQYERDAGRVVRRRYTFPPRVEETDWEDLASSDMPYMGRPQAGLHNSSVSFDDRKKLVVRKNILQKQWFSGAFIYYLPHGYDARNEIDRKALLAKEILGLDLDLETIWNLAPWSWAVDWFSNAGDVISNVNSFLEDGLVMPYGYMMEHTIVNVTYTRKHPNLLKSGAVDSAVTMVVETKVRRKANPFGFGVSWNGLSNIQLAILAALGITRS